MVSVAESNLWDSFLRVIRTKLQGESFETWFGPIRFEGIDQVRRLIRLRAPNQVVQDWVKSNYASLIDQSFGELRLAGYSVEWIVPEERIPAEARTVFSEVTAPSRSDSQPAASTQSFRRLLKVQQQLWQSPDRSLSTPRSTQNTLSIISWWVHAISLRTRHRSPSPKLRAKLTIHFICTAVLAWERLI